MRFIAKQTPMTKIGTKEKELKYVLKHSSSGIVDEKEVINFCHNHTQIPRATISAAMDSCLQTIGHYLALGRSVKLGDIGIFYVTADARTVDSNTEAGLGQLRGVNVRFRPSSELQDLVRKADKECEGVYRIVDFDKKIYEKIGTSAQEGSSSGSGGNTGNDSGGDTPGGGSGGSTGGGGDLEG